MGVSWCWLATGGVGVAVGLTVYYITQLATFPPQRGKATLYSLVNARAESRWLLLAWY